MKKMWSFKTENFEVVWSIEPERFDPYGMEPRFAEEIKKDIASKKMTCFNSEVKVVYRNTGQSLGEAYLGNSVYADPAEFRDHFGMTAGGYGSYFRQMVEEAIKMARDTFAQMREQQMRSAETLSKIHLKPNEDHASDARPGVKAEVAPPSTASKTNAPSVSAH